MSSGFGNKAFVVTGNNIARANIVFQQLKESNIDFTSHSISGEPTIDHVADAADVARKSDCHVVIGIGGGSVIDSAKAISALITNHGDILDYLEVVGQGKPLEHQAAPYIAIPTTSGTGAEVTKNSVLSVPDKKVKVSMRHPSMLPTIALVDPELTLSLPPEITATTGMDALTQLIEAYLSCKANPLTDGLCLEGLMRASRSLRKTVEDGSNLKAREDMSIASLFSGMALANAGLGAVHGFAGPMGGMFNAPHGALCARLLPSVYEINYSIAKEKDDKRMLGRFETIAQLLSASPVVKASDAIEILEEYVESFSIPGLSQFGVTENDYLDIVPKAKNASSMKGNPYELSDIALVDILSKSL